MRVLVTGAGGFIGRHLVSRLSAHSKVFAVVRDARQMVESEGARAVEMDLAGALNLENLPSRIDTIVHLAQANVSFPEAANELFAVSTNATQQLLDYGRRVGARHFILASTGDVYGRRFGLSKETDSPAPASHYAATKTAAELLVRSYSDQIAPCILRLYQPYGPGQQNRLIPKLAEKIRRRIAIELHKGDRPRMTPVYIADVTRAFECAIETAYTGIVNIAGDHAVSMRELAEEIGRALEMEPVFEQAGKDIGDLMGDNNLMKQAFGSWEMVALNEGLSRTLRSEEAPLWQKHV